MNSLVDVIAFINQQKIANPAWNKAQLQASYIQRFSPTKIRSVFVGKGYAIRFSEARTGSFSNTILSLSALQAYDNSPFVVSVVRDRKVDFLLANSTFLKKISHSSLKLRVDNIKGSFNGTDILTEYEGVSNEPKNFDRLFASHSAFKWDENVDRLVEATNAIVGRDNRFKPSKIQKETILTAPERAATSLRSPIFHKIEDELRKLIEKQRPLILQASALDNVNLRGNTIEQLLTASVNTHGLGDIERKLESGVLLIDIKTKLIDRASAPKAYNIDKLLAFLSEPGSVFAFFMIAVDIQRQIVTSRLLPVLEESILDATVIQHHWAGRSSRGVTQLSGRLVTVNSSYTARVNLAKARSFLERLVAI